MSRNNDTDLIHNADVMPADITKTRQVRVWDIVVRITHWTVAAGIIANLLFTKDGSACFASKS